MVSSGRSSSLVREVSVSRLPTVHGEFEVHAFMEDVSDNVAFEHLALVMGDVSQKDNVLTRVHSQCLTGDALFSLRCDCGEQLEQSMKLIAEEGQGIIVYLAQEGRGIGLVNKIKAYALQDTGVDTVSANEQLGFGADDRDYTAAAFMLQHFKITSIRLLTNNPHKLSALEALGVKVNERVSLVCEHNPHNEAYLNTKRSKMGHLLD